MNEINTYVLFPLILIGALNWGLIGLFNFNLVTAIFGADTVMSRIIYIVIGISSAIYIVALINNKW